jgi:hypothetical protein
MGIDEMKDFLSISCRILGVVLGGWMVNQLPALSSVPFDVPDYVVLIFVLAMFIVLTFLDQIVTSNQFSDQVKPLKHAISIVLVSVLASSCIFIFSTNLSTPQIFRKFCQYVSFAVLLVGLLLATAKLRYYVRENPEESQDALEERFLKANFVMVQTSQAISLIVNQLLNSESLENYLRKNLEQQEYLRGRVFELKNRFSYREEALEYLEEMVRQKSVSRYVSAQIVNRYAENNMHSTKLANMEEEFRMQINFILKLISISIRYGRSNSLKKGIGAPPLVNKIFDESVYHSAFQIARARVKELAIQQNLSSGAVKQIDDRFDDLIQLYRPVSLSAS